MRQALQAALKTTKFKVMLLLAGLGYWLLYALSSGMVFYYQADVSPLLATSQVPNPYLITSFGSFTGSYFSGIIWYPTGHLQLNLLIGPTFFSLLLSSLFGLNLLLAVYGLRFQGTNRPAGFSGLVAVIPAIFSGGCCSVPFGLALIGSLLPSAALFSMVYDYAFFTNATVAIVACVSLAYAAKRISFCALPKQG